MGWPRPRQPTPLHHLPARPVHCCGLADRSGLLDTLGRHRRRLLAVIVAEAQVHHAKGAREGDLGSVWFLWVAAGWRPGVWVEVAA